VELAHEWPANPDKIPQAPRIDPEQRAWHGRTEQGPAGLRAS